MKKLLHSVIAICFLFLGAVLYLYYSEEVYRQVFSNKYPIVISAADGQDKDAFLSFLEEAADVTDTPLFYTAVTDSASLKCTFHIYTTTMDEAFLGIPHDYPTDSLAPGDCISTQGAAGARAFAGNTSYHFAFYPLCDADLADVKSGLFYVDEDCEAFLQLLEEQKYSFSFEGIEDTSYFDMKMIAFVFMLVFVFILTLYYAYSRNREIVILKLSGYRTMDVFRSVFLRSWLYIWASAAVVFVLVLAVFAIAYGRTAIWFAGWALPIYLGYMVLMALVHAAACLLYVWRVVPKEIRAEKPKKWLQIVTMIVRFGSILTVIWGLSFSFYSVMQYMQFSQCWNNAKPYRDLVTMTLNTKGSGMEGDYDTKTFDFMQKVSEEYPTYIINSGDLEYESTLYVSESYFDLFTCRDTDGTQLTPDEISAGADDRTTVVVPDYAAADVPLEYRVVTYAGGQRFPVFDSFYVYNGGFVTDPVLYIYDEEMLREDAMTLVSCQYFFVDCGSKDALSKLQSSIEEAGITDVIREAVTVEGLFAEAMNNAGSFIIYYVVLGVFYLAILIALTIFETVVYFENNSRELCIRFLHGYGASASSGMWICKIITYLIVFVISWVMGYVMTFVYLAAVLDVLIFMTSMDRLKTTGMTRHLKGEI
ncbi:MAG: hypothetical protein IJN57_04110 [Oscillospiraceae bacterium]|nr:hypothetical protein [Oscillospiraceae bacterium]